MIKIVKVENLVKYARNCASFLESDRLSEKTKSEYRLRAETIRGFLALEEANRKYKPGTGKYKEWEECFDEAWKEYDRMIFG